jgi:hydroxypyruvate reductase
MNGSKDARLLENILEKEILWAGLGAADPREAVQRSLTLEDDRIITAEGDSFEAHRAFVFSAGKAAGRMAQAAQQLLGGKLAGGLVVTKDDHSAGPQGMETLYASHPEPDERGVEAARRAQEFVESLGEGDLLLTLISGGASALLADPAPPIELGGLKQLTQALLKSGADIEEVNTVRKHVSTLKGGGLVQLAVPAITLALLLSDVVGDEPSAIASGLTAPDPTTLEDAQNVLERYQIDPPQSVAAHLREAAETPKPSAKLFKQVANIICGSGRHAAQAASRKARELGYEPLILSTSITGDARGAAQMYAAIIREILESGNPTPPPCALISGGEATVMVRGDGTGGPNQEFALTLALELEGVAGWAALAADTDGQDGPTDAAGGIVTGATAKDIRKREIDPSTALQNNDAYAALKVAGALLLTGPTDTNVNDLRVALVDISGREDLRN